MTPLKIAFVNQPWLSSYPVPTSSLEIWTHEVARRLAAANEVHVFGGRNARSLRTDEFVDHEVRYHLYPTTVDAVLRRAMARLPLHDRPTRPSVARLRHYAVWANRTALALRRLKPDVIHIHNQFPFVRHIRRLNPNTRIVLHMQSEWLSQLEASDVMPALIRSDSVVGCSQHVVNRLISRLGEHVRHSAVIGNGVDPTMFAPRQDSDPVGRTGATIVFVGRISPEKGCHSLVSAFSELARQNEQLELRMIGPVGALPAEYIVRVSPEPFVRDLARFYREGGPSYWDQIAASVPPSIRERIKITGPLQRDEVALEIRNADILANPSLSETFGMALVEAMASGIPVVAATVGGMPEVVTDGVTGKLVPPDDQGALTSALAQLLDNPEERRQLGLAGIQKVRDSFTWETIASQTLDLYSSLVRAPATAPVPGAQTRRSEPSPEGN